MNIATRTLAVVAGIGTYLAAATLAVLAVRRGGRDLSTMRSRNSPRVLIIGLVANLVVLAAVLLWTRWILRSPLESLGFGAAPSHLLFVVVIGSLLFGSAVAFLFAVRKRSVRLTHAPGTVLLGAALPMTVLIAVALQEEVLFRGYLTLALQGMGLTYVVAGTSTLFVVVHLPTNRVSRWQVFNWSVGAVVLIATYLVTGSIWVAVGLHFATDAINVVVFRITGSHGLFAFDGALSDAERASYRALYTVLVGAVLVVWYGPQLSEPAACLVTAQAEISP